MIVKNEEANLPGALDSVDRIMDEIVICDTGSHDRTVACAWLYGATVVTEIWQDDFSRPRNRAIEASHCDWILWMDADDRLEPASAPALQRLWRSASPQAAAFCIVNQLRDMPPVEFLQTRLFPRRPAIRFERRIHEQIMFSAQRAGLPLTRHDTIRINHTGYHDPAVHRTKALRNLALIRTEQSFTPGDPTLAMSAADACYTLGDLDEALREYQGICADERLHAINADVFVQAHINCGLICFSRRQYDAARRYFFRSLYLDAKRTEAWFYLGRTMSLHGRNREAVEFFLQAARITPPLRLTAVNHTRIRLEAIYHLGQILIALQRTDEAIDLLRAAIRSFPTVPRYYSLLGETLLGRRKLTEAAAAFKTSLDLCAGNNEEAFLGMARIYLELADTVAAKGFLTRGLSYCPNGTALRELLATVERQASSQPQPSVTTVT
jgi:tetratricopeptide (TPR) repeat protein